jgi:hypothetical protein
MFGHDNDDTSSTQNNNQVLATTEPADDGILTLPQADEDTTSITPAPTDDDTGVEEIVPIPPQKPPEPTSVPDVPDHTDTPDNVDFLSIKQKALQQLKPLVGHLEQTPEERFRTTMMMIQAADDKSLIPQAYEAANAISDEKTHAQALLDVINEINYFSAQKEN